MDFELSPEQRLFRRVLREFCESTIEPVAADIDRKEEGIPDEIIKGLAELGVFGTTIPEEYGGSAMPGEEMSYATLAIQEIARADISMAIPVYSLLCLGWSYLVAQRGTDELKEQVLPKIASGEQFIGINTTEAHGGSDVSGIKTWARHEDGKFFLNGEKLYISGVTETEQRGGGHVTLFRTDTSLPYETAHRGMTFAYVDANLPGISRTLVHDIGRMGLSTGGFQYKDVEIPEYCVLGEVGRGFHMNMEGFNAARILVSAACVGGSEKVLEITRDYVKQRRLFGRPLAKFEAISFEIADDRAKLEMLRHYLRRAAWMVDRFYEDNTAFSMKAMNETIAICKLTAPTLATEIATHAMVHHGAFGYTTECPIGMNLRGALSYLVGAEGGKNIMKLIIGREYIGNVVIPYKDIE